MFGPKREELIGAWRNPYSIAYDLHSSPIIIWMIKSKNRIWARHMASIDEKRDVCIVFGGETCKKGAPWET